MSIRLLAVTSVLVLSACVEPESSGDESEPTTPNPSPTQDAVSAFVAFAEGDETEVSWADIVRLSIEGTQVARFGAARAGQRSTWNVCPSGEDQYEGRDCPVSPLRTLALAADEGEVVREDEPPDVIGCNRYSVPEDTKGTSVWLRPDDGQRSCFADFAILVALDSDGRVISVDLALSGP